jgi:hypothetical protein
MLSVLFGLVIVVVVILMAILVMRETQRASHVSRQELAYPQPIPGPPASYVVNGVDVRQMPGHIHDEDVAIKTAMVRGRDFSETINYRALSVGTSSPADGYRGYESSQLLVDHLS